MASIGLDITDDYIAVHVEQSETVLIKPAVIGCEKDGSAWYVGEDAYRAALNGTGVITDGLLTLLGKDGVKELGGEQYTAMELLSRLLSMLIEKALKDENACEATHVTAALHTADKELFDRVAACLMKMGYGEDEVTVISHSEAFMYFVLSQDRSFYVGNVALFDLGDGVLSFYEFSIQRGTGRQHVKCTCTGEEGFRTEILRTDTGKNLGDRIMTETAKRHMEGKVFSTVFLTGSGFSKTEWAGEFVSYTCHRRKLMLEEGIFAIGASLAADEKIADYILSCDTRISSELSMMVEIKGRDTELLLIPEGERWHNLRLMAEVMPCGQDYIDFIVTPHGLNAEKQRRRAMLTGFPEREDRTLRLCVEIGTVSAKAVKITISDMGFGDIFPPSGAVLCEEIEV
ncbi:MAG: DUF5716 family protein [Lachnospiraceae bacterium]|nr:DUF5716 family protein [Lachnospiraceae bacterium]